ncbi:MAG TPA: ISAs1 family transposase [Anaerolineae bacterium]|nr:ISAs1 family transposase [Anaerolineae bacterium]
MDDIIVNSGTEAVLFDVGSLVARFNTLADRRKAKGKRYSLALVLLLTMLAELSGEDTPYGIAEWAKHRCDSLATMLRLKRKKTPCHNTYRRVLAEAVDVEQLQEVTSEYLQQGRSSGISILIAIDGKTMQGTIPNGESKGVHLLAAYQPDEDVVLMQLEVGSKENEIAAAPRLLAALDLRGKVVRGDAMLTQRSLSLQIIEGGGDYLWLVKENQPALLADIEEVFGQAPTAPGWGQAPRDLRTAQIVNCGHGRVETRRLTASCFLNEYANWPGLAQVFKLERRVIITASGEVRRDTSLWHHEFDAGPSLSTLFTEAYAQLLGD